MREIAGLLPERFDAFEFLGRGAVSAVYGAKDKYLGRVVAVKVFDQGGMDSAELVRFQGEAKIISRLDHPNIVQVFDFGITDAGKPFMVLEYVKGTTLRSLLKTNSPLEHEDALSVFTGVASALAYAHGNGFSHRDLKPENLIIQSDHRDGMVAKIIDFGLAKYVHAKDAFTTHSGIALIGTPPYMPPDQASGKPFDVRSEIYSFGCVFFEALTGRPPFFADTPLEMISKHCSEAAPNIAGLNPGVDDDLRQLVERCLSKSPEDRPQSFQEIVKVLNGIASGSIEAAVLPDIEPKGSSNSLKLVIAFSVLAAGSVLLIYSALSPNHARNKAVKSSAIDRVDTSASGKHYEPFALNTLQSELADLNLVSDQKDSDLTPKADEMILRMASNITAIKKADFSNTDITDKILSTIGWLDQVQEFSLDYCKVTDAGLEELAKRAPHLNKLSIVDIAQLSKRGLKSLQRIPLTELRCGGNKLKDEDIRELSNFNVKTFLLNDIGINDRNAILFESKSVKYLDLRGNEIGIKGLSSLIKLPSIETIILSPSADLTSAKVDSLKNSLKSSCDVILRNGLWANDADKKRKSAVSNTVTLQPVRFDADANAIELQGEVTPADYQKVLNYPKATRLNARYLTNLSVEGFESVRQLPFQVVNLGGSNADDKIVAKLSGMNSIRKLVLSRTAVTNKSMASIAKLKNLNELILDECGITDDGLVALSKSSSIERLSIKNIGQVSEKGIRALCNLPLTNINFDGNHLTADDMKAASGLKAVQFSFKDAGLDDRAVSFFNHQRARTVEFTNNKIGPEGLREILKSRSLVEVWLSPHPRVFPAVVQSIRKSAKMGDCRVQFRNE